jgi:cob(I)alamin adenosyltransferase
MKIYTRTGDEGETGLFGGGRVPKTHLRVEAYGTVDELNAHLGRVVASVADSGVRERLETVQHDLFALGAILASPPSEGGERNPHVPPMPRHRIADMEGWMDAAEDELPPLRAFIVPGGTQGGAELHVARTVCRRAERRVVEMASSEADAADPETEHLVRYLNRLSDLLFVLARLENHRAGSGDVQWRKTPLTPGAGSAGGDAG